MVLLTLAVGCNGFIYSGEQSAMLDIANNFAGTLMGIINALGLFKRYHQDFKIVLVLEQSQGL